ncbi:MAG: Uma2 family endonuclease [Fimbriiglobus sp.]
MTTELAEATISKAPEYPFHIGYRLVQTVDANGKTVSTQVPLSFEDFIHPQEEDRFLVTDRHSLSIQYCRYALDYLCQEQPDIRIFSEHRTDWQVEGIKPHGPDVVAYKNFTADWDPSLGTLPVKDVGASPIVVIEVTSESTRKGDFEDKFLEFYDSGIPYYLIVDVACPYPGEAKVLGFRRTKSGYLALKDHDDLGVFVPGVNAYFRLENGELIIADESGKDIPSAVEAALLADSERARAKAAMERAEAEKQRAEAEKQRAEAATERAEAEKQRADDFARLVAELQAKLAPGGQ